MAICTCGGCSKVFSSQTLFDQHRIGNHGEPIYAKRDVEKEPKHKHPIAYERHTRHCMTTEELLAIGCQFECKQMTITIEGQTHKEERDIWYDPVARDAARAAFRKDEIVEETEDDARRD